jgi:hypothetical protein
MAMAMVLMPSQPSEHVSGGQETSVISLLGVQTFVA